MVLQTNTPVRVTTFATRCCSHSASLTQSPGASWLRRASIIGSAMLGLVLLTFSLTEISTASAGPIQQQPLDNGPLQPTVIGGLTTDALPSPGSDWQNFAPRPGGVPSSLTPSFPTSQSGTPPFLDQGTLTDPVIATSGLGQPSPAPFPANNLALPAEPVFANSGETSTAPVRQPTAFSVDDAGMINRQFREDGISSQLNAIRNPNLRSDQQAGRSQQNLPPIGQQETPSQPADWNRPTGSPLQGSSGTGAESSFSTSLTTQDSFPSFRPASFSGSSPQDGGFGSPAGTNGNLNSPGSGLPSPGGFGPSTNSGIAGGANSGLGGLQNSNSGFPSQESPLTMGTRGDFARSNGLLPSDRSSLNAAANLGNMQQKQAIVEQINSKVESPPVTENPRPGYNTTRKPLANADRTALPTTPTGLSNAVESGQENTGNATQGGKTPLANSTNQSTDSLTSLLFVISVAVNFLLAYLIYDTRRNYRDLADELQDRFFRDTV